MVLHLMPCWRDKKALAEDADALARRHEALDVQDRAGAWNIQHAEFLIRECADDLHHAIAPVSCHASAYAGPAQAEKPSDLDLGPKDLSQNGYGNNMANYGNMCALNNKNMVVVIIIIIIIIIVIIIIIIILIKIIMIVTTMILIMIIIN